MTADVTAPTPEQPRSRGQARWVHRCDAGHQWVEIVSRPQRNAEHPRRLRCLCGMASATVERRP